MATKRFFLNKIMYLLPIFLFLSMLGDTTPVKAQQSSCQAMSSITGLVVGGGLVGYSCAGNFWNAKQCSQWGQASCLADILNCPAGSTLQITGSDGANYVNFAKGVDGLSCNANNNQMLLYYICVVN